MVDTLIGMSDTEAYLDEYYVRDIIDDNSGHIEIIDISFILPHIMSKVELYKEYILTVCLPSIEIDIMYLEEEGVLGFYGVNVEEFEYHQGMLSKLIFDKFDYHGLYNSMPIALKGNMYYIYISTV